METSSAATAIQTGLGMLRRWDASVLAAAGRFEVRGLGRVMRGLTRAGDTPGWIVHGLVLAALLRVEDRVIAGMVVAAVLATLTSQLAKRFFRRHRPSVAIPGFRARAGDPDPYSFPSGHSTVAFAIATAAMLANPVLGAVEACLAASIAVSRVYLGAHYPADVLGGVVLGITCGVGARALLG